MADAVTRILNFTTGFSMKANSAACRRLSAPGLQEIYANLPRQVAEPPADRGNKRLEPPAGGAEAPNAKKSRNQKKNANWAQLAPINGSARSAAPPGGQGWQAQPPPTAKKVDAKGAKRGKGGKGEGKGGKVPLPANVKRQTASGKHICFSFNLHFRARLLVVRRHTSLL